MFNVKLPGVNITSVATTAAIGGALIGATFLINKTSIRYSGAPPGPRRIPIIGNIELAPEDGPSFNKALQELCKKYGPILCMYMGNVPIVVISDYDILREAFLVKGVEFAGRPHASMIESYNPGYPTTLGIIDADYSEEWKRQRNNALLILRTLGMGKSITEQSIQEESNVLLQELAKKNGEALNPHKLLETSVANIICSLLFGERYEHGDEELQAHLRCLDTILIGLMQAPGIDYIPIMKLLPSYQRAKRNAFEAGSRLIKFYRKKIQEAKDKLAGGVEAEDFVSLYIQELEKTNRPDAQIKEDWTIQLMQDFFLAGAESNSSTLRWAVLYMANHQEVQEKVFREINSKLGKNDTICLMDRKNLLYTEATIMEIQRIISLGPIAVPHKTMVDTTLAGYTIPKGAEVWGNLYGVLKDPENFPEPDKLKPERFLNKTLDSLEKNEKWVPFSLGRRTCLGEQFARQELFLFFTNIIRSFKILPPEGVEQIPFTAVFVFVLKPTDYKVRFIARSQ